MDIRADLPGGALDPASNRRQSAWAAGSFRRLLSMGGWARPSGKGPQGAGRQAQTEPHRAGADYMQQVADFTEHFVTKDCAKQAPGYCDVVEPVSDLCVGRLPGPGACGRPIEVSSGW